MVYKVLWPNLLWTLHCLNPWSGPFVAQDPLWWQENWNALVHFWGTITNGQRCCMHTSGSQRLCPCHTVGSKLTAGYWRGRAERGNRLKEANLGERHTLDPIHFSTHPILFFSSDICWQKSWYGSENTHKQPEGIPRGKWKKCYVDLLLAFWLLPPPRPAIACRCCSVARSKISLLVPCIKKQDLVWMGCIESTSIHTDTFEKQEKTSLDPSATCSVSCLFFRIQGAAFFKHRVVLSSVVIISCFWMWPLPFQIIKHSRIG